MISWMLFAKEDLPQISSEAGSASLLRNWTRKSFLIGTLEEIMSCVKRTIFRNRVQSNLSFAITKVVATHELVMSEKLDARRLNAFSMPVSLLTPVPGKQENNR